MGCRLVRSVVALSICCALLVASVSGTVAAELSWNGWLGGSARRGWVGGFVPPSAWPQELVAVWKVDVGTGYGSPIVADGLVYQHARQGDNEVVWCLDLNRGEMQWKHRQATPFKMGSGGEWHGKGPKSSPAFADGRLFTMSIAGVLTALDGATGEVLWQRNYGSRFEANTPYWGASTSPLIDGDRVVVHLGNDDEGVLAAFDTKSGVEVWTQGNSGASYSSPLIAEIDGVRQVVEWNHDSLVGVSSTTGELLWEHPFPHDGSNQNMPTPTFYKGMIVLGGENRGIHGLVPQRDGEAWSVREIWANADVALDMSSAVVNGDSIFGFSHYGKGRLFCLDLKTGKVLWQSPGRVGSNVMFLSVPGHVVALLDNGELQVIRATRERYDKVATYQVSDQPTWAPPVLLRNGVLVKDRDRLVRFAFPSEQ